MPHSWLRSVGDSVVVAGDALEVAEEGFGASLEVEVCGAHVRNPLGLPQANSPLGFVAMGGVYTCLIAVINVGRVRTCFGARARALPRRGVVPPLQG